MEQSLAANQITHFRAENQRIKNELLHSVKIVHALKIVYFTQRDTLQSSVNRPCLYNANNLGCMLYQFKSIYYEGRYVDPGSHTLQEVTDDSTGTDRI